VDWNTVALVVVAIVLVWSAIAIVLVVVGQRWLARELALLLPNVGRLFAGLLRDQRVPLPAKIALGLASLWIASPIDLIPEFIPVAGALDDAIVAVIALRFVLRWTDVEVLREHWHGDPRTFDRVLRLAGRRALTAGS
jgi:uncharacterized membrane protein YkvA (DUF1232 family)